MFINCSKYKRNDLTQDQKEFLHVLVPFGRMVQEQIKNKCLFAKINTKSGINASVICADAILKSEWGEHKIAKKYNNLNLLESDDFWYGKEREFENKFYRIYDCWFDYASDLSDHIVFSGKYEQALTAKNLDLQIDALTFVNCQIPDYRSKIDLMIGSLGLTEFDLL